MTRVRVGLAVVLAGCASITGAGIGAPTAAAAAVTPIGGCWAYTPSGTALDAPPTADISTALEAWTTKPADGAIVLETSGATTPQGERTITVKVVNGPVVSAARAATGQASFLLSVDGAPLPAPLTADFSADAGKPVENVTGTAKVKVPAGTHDVRLDRVYFDSPGATPADSVRVACNGQTQGVASPTGPNPATTPLSTDVVSGWTTVASSSVSITGVADQAVTTAARPPDTVTLQASGLASSAPATIELCPATGACVAVGTATTDAAGALTASFSLPGNAPVGAGTLRVGDGTTSVSTPFRVLSVQTVVAAEKLGTDSTLITLTGTGWDPQRALTIRGYTGSDSSSKPTGDPVVTAKADDTGAFTATYEVADEDTTSVIVDQARSSAHIGAVYLISGVIGGAGPLTPADPDDPDSDDGSSGSGGDTGSGSGSGSGSGGTGGVVTTPIEPLAPEEIPLPPDLPVDEPGAETPGEEAPSAEELVVSEARLDGQATMSELFGGSPKRDLVFLVENIGDTTVENPIVRVSVGRSEDVEPEIVDAEVGVLDPGEQTVVTVPLTLPMAAFGSYYVVGQVGESDLGAFELEWTTYPWGLIALDVLAVALLVYGVRHRLAGRKRAQLAVIGAPDDGAAVVALDAAEAWWAYRAGVGPRPRARVEPMPASEIVVAPPPPVVEEAVGGDAVIDLEAAEAWWARRRASGEEASTRVS